MSSLQERLDDLQRDLLATPPRINAYHDLPFAIFRYDPTAEYEARKQMGFLATRVENAGRAVHFISLAKLLWTAVEQTEGIAAIAQEERQLGFARAHTTVSTLLSDASFMPLATALNQQMQDFDAAADVVFLVRTAALSPAIYRCAKLLDEMHGRTMVPIILFYPGTLEGTTSLRYLDLPDREQTGAYNYRVKIY
jgi:hypothetical protein